MRKKPPSGKMKPCLFNVIFDFCLEAASSSACPLVLFFSKLQSELRTTNLEELKITVETYFEEVSLISVYLLCFYNMRFSQQTPEPKKEMIKRWKKNGVKMKEVFDCCDASAAVKSSAIITFTLAVK